ncbi:sulfur carrier protein ThiS [Williamsia sterculiae]|uniref:sulfur carrier protein ThiS n=1 Tax=Williamsia sterculiae TaxID=1344003 RepID=UPI000970BE9A
MTATVNGTPTRVADGATVSDVLTGLGVGEAGIAVALDGAVHPRGRWSEPVCDGAVIEVLTAVQGG